MSVYVRDLYGNNFLEQPICPAPVQHKLDRRVLICSDVAPYRNGVGAYYADLYADLRDDVAELDLLCPVADGGRLTGFNVPLPGDTTQHVPLPNLAKLAQRIEKFQPDVVVVASQGAYGVVGARVGHRIGARVLAGYQTSFTHLVGLYWDKWRTLGAHMLVGTFNRYVFRHADEVLANSPDMMKLARSHGARRVRLIGTPITPKYLNTPIRRVPDCVSKVLFVGRLAAEKRLDAVVAAAIALPNLRFSIVGDGPERARLEKATAELSNIELLGWIDRSRMDQVMDDHDVLVLPSKVEGFGTVALEAMARQRLVVVSHTCGISTWPCLRKGLTVMGPQENLTQVLTGLCQLSDIDCFSRGAIARAAARQHVLWNRQLWLSSLRARSARPARRLGRLGGWKTCTLLSGLW